MQITIRQYDEDDPPHTLVAVSGGGCAAQQDAYIDEASWLEFGRALQGFPRDLTHAVTFAHGSPDPSSYCHIELRAYVYDSVGHTALRVRMTNHGRDPQARSASFSLLVEAATLNRFGARLEQWVLGTEPGFEFSFGEGE